MLISKDYAAQNSALHHAVPSYGANGGRHAKPVRALMDKHGLKTLLDYGCGKGSLIALFPGAVGYDPAIPELSALPIGPFDLVTCTDVLEHIEPECLDAVLDHIAGLGQWVYLLASTKPAKKFLPDGRNAHLIVESPQWWEATLSRYFAGSVSVGTDEVLFVGQPL